MNSILFPISKCTKPTVVPVLTSFSNMITNTNFINLQRRYKQILQNHYKKEVKFCKIIISSQNKMKRALFSLKFASSFYSVRNDREQYSLWLKYYSGFNDIHCNGLYFDIYWQQSIFLFHNISDS